VRYAMITHVILALHLF